MISSFSNELFLEIYKKVFFEKMNYLIDGKRRRRKKDIAEECPFIKDSIPFKEKFELVAKKELEENRKIEMDENNESVRKI